MSAVMNDRLPRPRVSVEEYYRMAEVGLLAPDARTELIEGEVIEMGRMGSPHAGKVGQLNHLIVPVLGYSAQIRVQLPVHLDDYSEPMPDLAVVRPQKDFYTSRHPGSADTLLIVEVSDSSLRFDRGRESSPLCSASGAGGVAPGSLARSNPFLSCAAGRNLHRRLVHGRPEGRRVVGAAGNYGRPFRAIRILSPGCLCWLAIRTTTLDVLRPHARRGRRFAVRR